MSFAPRTAEEVAQHFGVSRESRDRLEVYVALLRRWQDRTNLVGRSTLAGIWARHIADALQLMPLLPQGCRTIADLGSGAGIPGLPLALATGLHVHLVESNGKKAAFLREAVRETGANATVHPGRIETVRFSPAPDIVTARALASLPKLLELAAPLIERGARALFHKGQDVDRELTEAGKSWRIDAVKHPSLIDPLGVILEVKELSRVAR